MRLSFIYYTFILSFLVASSCQQGSTDSQMTDIQLLIDSLRLEYAPDKRVAIWEISTTETPRGVQIKGTTNLPRAKEALQATLEQQQLEWMDSIRVLPNPDLEDNLFGIVNLSACNIRSRPAHSEELATQSTLGTLLKIWDKSDDWYRVQTPDGYLGWLDAGGLQLINPQIRDEYLRSDRVIFLPDIGFSYVEANENSQPVSDLLAGNILIRIGRQGRFTQVAYPDGRKAFVRSEQLADWDEWLASRRPTPANILADAQRMLGRPYLWGGTSGKAFDCSGFTKTVFYLNGLILPRDASQQIQVGAPLNTSHIRDLQAGDLLFFGRAATAEQKEKITHVAIYMGNHKIIHATGSVKIESLNPEDPDFAAERLATFVRATRPLQAPGKYGISALNNSEWY
jgi:cell wall-associated NlpC family hydrolase